ncbi:hypothetical protein AQAU111925_09255 [Aquirufa aurantiipilula]
MEVPPFQNMAEIDPVATFHALEIVEVSNRKGVLVDLADPVVQVVPPPEAVVAGQASNKYTPASSTKISFPSTLILLWSLRTKTVSTYLSVTSNFNTRTANKSPSSPGESSKPFK